jgi:hypothetical protein
MEYQNYLPQNFGVGVKFNKKDIIEYFQSQIDEPLTDCDVKIIEATFDKHHDSILRNLDHDS